MLTYSVGLGFCFLYVFIFSHTIISVYEPQRLWQGCAYALSFGCLLIVCNELFGTSEILSKQITFTYHTFAGFTLKLPLFSILKCQGRVRMVTACTFVTVGAAIIVNICSRTIAFCLMANGYSLLQVYKEIVTGCRCSTLFGISSNFKKGNKLVYTLPNYTLANLMKENML